MNRSLLTIHEIQTELNELASKKNFAQAQRVILSIVRLLDNSVSLDDQNQFQLFADSDGKIRANGSWFYEDQIIIDRKATYKIHSENELNIDFKLYGITKPSKRTISWIQALIPNFEDEPFNSKFNIGIDFVVPKSVDKVIIVLSNNYVVRTLELKGTLTATYQEILLKWAEIIDFSNKKEVHSILWESFDLQPINKKFYSGISERFIILRQHLTKEKIFDEKHASLFANRLIGRVIFCWFLDKKGVINPDQKYFDAQSFSSSTDYYRGRLENLFYRVLNTPISERDRVSYGDKDLFGKGEKKTLFAIDDTTPFLNGGLFEPRETDLFEDKKLTFSKDYFDDLFEFLSGYNFTTDESTSQFQQVAIDPEMLGRIFENLLAEMSEETGEQARKAKGAFYTPREIVDYMCRESLKEYLKTKITEDEHRDQRLYQLIDAPDKDFQDQDHNWRRDWKPYKDTIIKALDELKVLDPACGSGAFPIGMLQLLVRVYERLETRFDSYKTKLQIIERNIYGVDIEPMAIEIARLRTWLSIIVDEESDSKKIKPLPNLEFKFACANSLIDLDQSGQNAIEEDSGLEKKLQDIRDSYFNTESIAKKKKLRFDYDKLVKTTSSLFGESEKSKQLKTYRPFDNESSADFFNPEFMFGVIDFNIVIGNPPYISALVASKILSPEIRQKYKDNYLSASGTYDIYLLFFERGINLLSNIGILSFISPSKYLSASYAQSFREKVGKNKLYRITDFSQARVFESAGVSTLVSFYKGEELEENVITHKLKDVRSFTNYESITNSRASLAEFPEFLWGHLISDNYGILKKIFDKSELLSNLVEVNGSSTASEAERFSNYIFQGDETIGKKIINTGTMRPYVDLWGIKGYLHKKQKLLKPMLDLKEVGDRRIKMYHSPKCIIPKLNSRLNTVIDTDGEYASTNTTFVFDFTDDVPILFVGSLLNSKLYNFIYKSIFSGLNMLGSFQFQAPQIRLLPIPKNTKKEDRIKIMSIVKQIINSKKQDFETDTTKLEQEIDELVMDLYGLNKEEKEIIRNS